jgi:DNA polymerase-3 subunit epsilon
VRQVVLDTETTGLEARQGHRIVEIGCVELVNRKLTGRHYHQYINPEREVEEQAVEIHGLTNEFLDDKPVFAQITDEFLAFIKGAELIIHNAPFDVEFINVEFDRLDSGLDNVESYCGIIDTLVMARQKHPGQRNNLDALCQRYGVDNSQRDLHGALLDSEILADVYLMMTGGQTNLLLSDEDAAHDGEAGGASIRRLDAGRPALKIIRANESELAAHEERLNEVEKASEGNCVWRQPKV